MQAYRHNLSVLRKFHHFNFPLQKYIVDLETEISPPRYILQAETLELAELTRPVVKLQSILESDEIMEAVMYDRTNSDEPAVNPQIEALEVYLLNKRFQYGGPTVRVRVLDEASWPDAPTFGLDPSQYTALKAALTKQMAIIQGPPGKLISSVDQFFRSLVYQMNGITSGELKQRRSSLSLMEFYRFFS